MSAEVSLADRVVGLHLALESGGIPHAFGGALALAWCTRRARGTIDIDVNLFVGVDRLDDVLTSLPRAITATDQQRAEIDHDGQTRLWWDATPVDVFFNTTSFHEGAAERARQESFNGHDVPFLDCSDLAVFKAFFDRTRDWADLEEMYAAGTLDVTSLVGTLTLLLGVDDRRVARLLALVDPR